VDERRDVDFIVEAVAKVADVFADDHAGDHRFGDRVAAC
jgi:hypothetical protein